MVAKVPDNNINWCLIVSATFMILIVLEYVSQDDVIIQQQSIEEKIGLLYDAWKYRNII